MRPTEDWTSTNEEAKACQAHTSSEEACQFKKNIVLYSRPANRSKGYHRHVDRGNGDEGRDIEDEHLYTPSRQSRIGV